MSISYKRHRFPAELISYCVWLYYTFPLSFRDIEKMMLYRGFKVTYEALRQWCLKLTLSRDPIPLAKYFLTLELVQKGMCRVINKLSGHGSKTAIFG